ncbi:MAG: hypothetical protein PHO78_00155 [Methanomicrobium sp.]|jgi:KaiC/GvpD/RAD55 family RecA-like ATPase|nr:hypothetical protein [Methanomicrobium sp.]
MSPEIEQISSIKSDKRSTGIIGLDFQLGGGIPKGKSLILFGDALSGMEILAEQFWHADKSNESTYIMIDSLPKEGMINAGELNISDLSAVLKGDWVVIDSLSSIILNFGIDAAVSFLDNGLAKIKNNGGNVLLILYSNVHARADEIKVTRHSDIFISLSNVLHGNEIERNLTINKISGADVPKRAYPYNILASVIELSTTGRVV